MIEKAPGECTSFEQHRSCPEAMRPWYARSAYGRVQNFRSISVLAPAFGAETLPPVQTEDWDLLCEFLPGTSSGVKDFKLGDFYQAKMFVGCLNYRLDDPGLNSKNGPYNLYDLSCALCLQAGWKDTHPLDENSPYTVRTHDKTLSSWMKALHPPHQKAVPIQIPAPKAAPIQSPDPKAASTRASSSGAVSRRPAAKAAARPQAAARAEATAPSGNQAEPVAAAAPEASTLAAAA